MAEEKTPLQGVTGVLCDALCELPLEERQRALDIVILTLGIERPSTQRFEQQEVLLQKLDALFKALRPEQLTEFFAVFDQAQRHLLSDVAQSVTLLQSTAQGPS